MPKKQNLKEFLESLEPEQLQEIRDALKVEGSDTDLAETVLTMQAEIKEILGLVKPKPAGPPKRVEGVLGVLGSYFGVK